MSGPAGDRSATGPSAYRFRVHSIARFGTVQLPQELVLVGSLVGFASGISMLARGLASYRTSSRIADTATSSITGLAVGESRISGVVESAELLLVSPLQSAPCVYYRAAVEESEERSTRTVFRDERAVGFRIRDATGTIRVFPRGARWAIPDRFHEGTSMLGAQPASLDIRLGPALTPGVVDRETAIASLLTVRDEHPADPQLRTLLGSGHRSYREARIEPGDVVTVIGFVAPFDQLPDPTSADDATFGEELVGDPLADPAIAADMAAARDSGELAADAAEAWGNAAIPGFGIGQPVREPELDAGANRLPLASAEAAQRIDRTFAISPETLVVTAAPDVSLFVTMGAPAVAVAREEGRFIRGLFGAVLAIVSALILALAVTGGIAL